MNRQLVTILLFLLNSNALMANEARILVRPGKEIGEVNRLILGNNMLAYQGKNDEYGNRGAGIWDPAERRPEPAFVQLAREAGLSVLRWPGGCGAHNYNWKLTVGPLEDRPDQQFGLPEFLFYCKAVDAVPILTLAVYWGEPEDGADLVEYLNSPHDGSNPNGGTDWAAVRAADGSPEPFDVVWFEYGNESYHGEHHPTGGRDKKRIFSPQTYAERYLAYAKAMKAVDDRIKLGAIIQWGQTGWNRTVLQTAGREMDFAIEHTYTPGHGRDTTHEQTRLFMEACLASGGHIQRIYDVLNRQVEEETGRTDLSWAITEYNGHFVQSEPVPYRQTLGNALRNAEHIRIMMRPRNRIALANFWQFSNEYWGMARGYVYKGDPVVKQANFYVYELYEKAFGDILIDSEVACDRWDFQGGAWTPKRSGEPSEFELLEGELLPKYYEWTVWDNSSVKQRVDGGTLEVTFQNEDTNYYHGSVQLPAEPDTGYRVTGLIRTQGLTSGRGATFQVGDARGYDATHSCQVGVDLLGDNDWTEVVVEYVTLEDTEEITIMARRVGHVGGDKPIAGRASYKLKSVQRYTPANLGGVPDVTVNAAKRADGSVTLMMVNTNLDEDVEAHIEIEGVKPTAATQGRATSLVADKAWATNLGPEPEVRLVETPVEKDGDHWRVILPKHSLTALEVGGGTR